MVGFTHSDMLRDMRRMYRPDRVTPPVEPWAEPPDPFTTYDRFIGDTDVRYRVVQFRWTSDPAEEARRRRERWERREDEAAGVMGWDTEVVR